MPPFKKPVPGGPGNSLTMTTDWEKLQSKSIDLLRFPMAAAVVILHYGTTKISYATGLLRGLCIVFEEGICRLAVPCFFLISGYLFFHQLQDWNWSIWREKLKRRVRTLLAPYILWNIITFLALYLYSAIHGEHISIVQRFQDVGGIRIFWGIGGNLPLGMRDTPLDGPLWFIRDLIYFTVATPLIYLFVKQTRWVGILLICLIFIFVQGIIPEGFVFFLSGAFLQINKKNMLNLVYPKRFVFYAASLLLLVAFYFFFDSTYWARFLKTLFFFAGISASFCLAATILQKNTVQPNDFLIRSSFFIFAAHNFLILRQIASPFVARILPLSERQIWSCIDFFLTPVVTILICITLLFLMEKFLPKGAALLTGHRYKTRF